MVGKRTLIALAVAGLLAACGGSGSGDESDASDTTVTTETTEPSDSGGETSAKHPDVKPVGPPYIGAVTFAWPTDCAVPATEILNAGGSAVELAYDVTIATDGDGKALSYTDLKVTAVDGQDVPDAAAEQILEPLAALNPPFKVNAAGEYAGMSDPDAALERVAGAPGEMGQVAEAAPQAVLALLDARANQTWDTWVGSWAALKSVDEAELNKTVPYPAGDRTVDVPVAVRSLGTTEAGAAVLEGVILFEGDGFQAVAADALQELGLFDQVGGEAASVQGKKLTSMRAVVNVSDLKPTTATYREDIEVTAAGETQTKVVTRDWWFDWAHSTCT